MAVMFRITGDGQRQRFYYFGREITREEYERLSAEHRPPELAGGERGSSFCGWKPLASESYAYHPKQIKEAEAFLKSRDCPTEIDPTGRPLFTSRSHRRRFLKVNRAHDNDGGYGDG